MLTYFPNGGEFNGDGSIESVKIASKKEKQHKKLLSFNCFTGCSPSATAFLIFPTIKVTIKTTFSGHLEREKVFPAKNPSNASLMFLGPIFLVMEVSICER